jgi:hypothetical protein
MTVESNGISEEPMSDSGLPQASDCDKLSRGSKRRRSKQGSMSSKVDRHQKMLDSFDQYVLQN